MTQHQGHLFEGSAQAIAPGLVLLSAHADTSAVARAIAPLLHTSPLRQMTVPGGGRMAVAMSNCGALG
jgi:DNA oxidative demethylase